MFKSALILASVSFCAFTSLCLLSCWTWGWLKIFINVESTFLLLSEKNCHQQHSHSNQLVFRLLTSFKSWSSSLLLSSWETSVKSSSLRFRKESRSWMRSMSCWSSSNLSLMSSRTVWSTLKILLLPSSWMSMSQVPSSWPIYNKDYDALKYSARLLTLVAMLGDLLLVPILVSKVIGGGGGGGSRGAAGLVAVAGRGAGGRRRRWGGELRQDCKKFCCLCKEWLILMEIKNIWGEAFLEGRQFWNI